MADDETDPYADVQREALAACTDAQIIDFWVEANGARHLARDEAIAAAQRERVAEKRADVLWAEVRRRGLHL